MAIRKVFSRNIKNALKKKPDLKYEWDKMKTEHAILVEGFEIATKTELNLLERKFKRDADCLLEEAQKRAEELEALFASRTHEFLEEHFPEMFNESEKAKKLRVDK